MRLEFDTANMAEVTAVAALIAHLRGDSGPVTFTDDTTTIVGRGGEIIASLDAPAPAGQSDIIPPPLPPLADTGNDDAPDAAAAFGGAGAGPASPVVTSPVPPPPPVTAAPAGAVEVDADGLPWDARIHSTPASKNKSDNKWRAKRSLDATVKAEVEAELRRTMNAPLAPAAAAPAAVAPPPPPAPPVPPAPPAPALTESGPAAATIADNPPPPPPPPVAATAAVAADLPVTDFASLMRKVTKLQTAGKLTVAETTENAKALGVDGLRSFMSRPDLIPAFDALLPEVG